ncbi:MAG: SPFH domain-containing protein [Nitrospinae bacterium]|nr:SPFH domain-containing protein [Nitrospinota bacterium]
MKKHLLTLIALALAVSSGACGFTRVETGEAGLRKTWDGEIKSEELGVGFHQTIVGSVIIFATKEILLTEENMTPASKDKSTLKDFDINFTYTVDPKSIAELYTKYSITSHMTNPKSEGYEIFPMGNFVTTIVRAATYSAVAEFDALEVNNNRKQIEERVKSLANEKLAGEKLEGKVHVNMVTVRNIQLAPEIVESANRVSQAQNELTAKKTQVEIAVQEGRRIEALSRQTDEKYVRLLNAQAAMKTAEAIEEAAKKGSTIWVVPNNFVSLGNTTGR